MSKKLEEPGSNGRAVSGQRLALFRRHSQTQAKSRLCASHWPNFPIGFHFPIHALTIKLFYRTSALSHRSHCCKDHRRLCTSCCSISPNPPQLRNGSHLVRHHGRHRPRHPGSRRLHLRLPHHRCQAHRWCACAADGEDRVLGGEEGGVEGERAAAAGGGGDIRGDDGGGAPGVGAGGRAVERRGDGAGAGGEQPAADVDPGGRDGGGVGALLHVLREPARGRRRLRPLALDVSEACAISSALPRGRCPWDGARRRGPCGVTYSISRISPTCT